jgi:acyl-CoA thioesterase FadM
MSDRLRTSSVGNTSWVTEYEIYKEDDDDRLIASGKTVQVAFDFKEGKPLPIPPEIREKLLHETVSGKE